jgi:integrase
MKISQHNFQSSLAPDITRFLTHKRALGKKFGTEEKTLWLMDRYLIQQRISSITQITPAFLDAFLASRPRQERSYNLLLSVVRRLFHWLVQQEVITQSPLRANSKRPGSPRNPFIFDRHQVTRVLETAAQLPATPRSPQRAETYQVIFALLYGLGLRVGEVCRLCFQDVNFERNYLMIHQTKFSKSRLVPFGPRMRERLCKYLEHYEILFGPPLPQYPLFSFKKNPPQHVSSTNISCTFHQLVSQLELKVPPGVAPPRLHGLRHSFAVGTLLRWYRMGIDPGQQLIYLSTFLGHVSPTSTAVYLTITADLLQEASQRFERFAAPTLEEVSR